MRPFFNAFAKTFVGILLAGQAHAQDYICYMRELPCASECSDTTVEFSIDTSQFAAPQDPNDPPRRQVTQVTLDDTSFSAEAIWMSGGIRGFHHDAGALGSRLMIVQREGYARLSLQPENQTLTGFCTRYVKRP